MHLLVASILTGCGFGLTMEGGVQPDEPEGGLTELEEDSGLGLDTVDGTLEGVTWSMDLAECVGVEPTGIEGLLMLMGSSTLLLHVAHESSSALEFYVAMTGEDGLQDLCQPVVALPAADWTGNPCFAISDGQLMLSVNGYPVALRQLQLSGNVYVDGSGFDLGELFAEVDSRELDAAFAGDLDMSVCELLEAVGDTCQACDDGFPGCFDVHLQSLEGVEHGEGFELNPDC